MPSGIPWQTPLPQTATLWVDEYWKIQPIDLIDIWVDKSNRIHANYKFRTPCGEFAGCMVTPPLGFDATGGPYFHGDLPPFPGLSERQWSSVLYHLVTTFVDWDVPSEEVVWHDPLPSAIDIELDGDTTERIQFTEIAVSDNRITARYELNVEERVSTGRLRTSRVVFDRGWGLDYCTRLQTIDGLGEKESDEVCMLLLQELARWDELRIGPNILRGIIAAAPVGVRVTNLLVWQQGQRYGTDPKLPWWRAVNYIDREGRYKIAVDGPATHMVGTDRCGKPQVVDDEDDAMLGLLVQHVHPEEIHAQHVEADELD